MDIKKLRTSANNAKICREIVGSQNEIEAMFAQATALFAAKRYNKAASVYVATVPLTTAQNTPLLTMEAWLMGAYCQEIMGNTGWALAYAKVALHYAERVSQRMRPASTIANVGEAIIRQIRTLNLIGHAKGIPTEAEINERMVLLLGENWRDQSISLEQLVGASVTRFACKSSENLPKRFVTETASELTAATRCQHQS